MQVILTEEEYIALKSKADNYDQAQYALSTVCSKLEEVQTKYHNLLVFGVSVNNEKSKLFN